MDGFKFDNAAHMAMGFLAGPRLLGPFLLYQIVKHGLVDQDGVAGGFPCIAEFLIGWGARRMIDESMTRTTVITPDDFYSQWTQNVCRDDLSRTWSD